MCGATDQLDVNDGGRCSCGVSAIVRITLRDGTYHEDIGYGHCEGIRGKHAALEKVRVCLQCKKEAVTDSIKRGLKTFGRLLGYVAAHRNCLYDRQYANAVLRVPAARMPFNADSLHRHDEAPLKREAPEASERQEPAKAARLRQAEAAKAAHRKKAEGAAPAPAQPAPAPPAAKTHTDDVHDRETKSQCDWLDESSHAEAASMAVELELEEDMFLRQSQLDQELAEDSV